jgi:chromate transporter
MSAPTDHDELPPAPVPFRSALGFWLKIGFLSFGGPAGQIALLHQEVVENKRWVSERRFLHALNYCMLLPGPEAQQLATYIGWLMHRSWGGIAAGALFVLPSLLILILLSWLYVAFGDVALVQGLFYGIKPAVTAIVLHAAYRIGSRVLSNGWLWAIAVGAFVAIFALHVPFPAIVVGAAAAGYLGNRFAPERFKAKAAHGASAVGYGPALIDDDTPIPAHARFRWHALVRASVVGLLLWAAPMGVMWGALGWDHPWTQMGWFFTKAALLTFGGAYAVLPYVYQGVVEHYRWLTPAQMVDGLALGETTPGPLIMVVAFAGFVGAYTHPLFAPDASLMAGVVAAMVVTWFTFLPSFLFILIGGPFVETTRGNLSFTAPLTGVTAAVVGVIVNLALFFAYHVFWPQGFAGRVDLSSLAIALAAAAALFFFKQSVVRVIAACAAAGLLFKTFA